MLEAIELLVLDVDGVLTDGGVHVDDRGVESRRFSVRDGFGIAAARRSGLQVAVASGRASPLVRLRMAELGVAPVLQGVRDKRAALEQLCAGMDLDPARAAYMGDDLVDLPAMARAGAGMAPADAAPEVLARADWVAGARGGHGAVREAIEAILGARGLWQAVLERFGG